MKIRLMGPTDLVERVVEIFGLNTKTYPNRGAGDDSRAYVDIDDRKFEKMLDQLEAKRKLIFEDEKPVKKIERRHSL